MSEDPLQALRDAVRGLLYPSESDEPIEVFVWDRKEADAKSAIAAQVAKDALVQEVDLADFFRELETSDGGQQFKNLHRILITTLTGVRGYRAGEVEVQIYLIGRTPDGKWAGLHTISVET
jgi:hypothetical protein